MSNSNNFLPILISLFIPPLGVALKKGLGTDLILNIILTLLFFFPGLIHAIWIITKD